MATRKKPAPKAKARRTKRTPKKRSAPDWAPRFLAALADSANIRASCIAARVGRSTVYERRDADKDFAGTMAAALEDACDDLELEARRRAKDGVTRPIFGSGGTGVGSVEVGCVQEYSDMLMMFLLKAHRPEKFRENVKHEHSGPGGGPVEAKVTHDVCADLAPYAAAVADLLAGRLGAPPAGTVPSDGRL